MEAVIILAKIKGAKLEYFVMDLGYCFKLNVANHIDWVIVVGLKCVA